MLQTRPSLPKCPNVSQNVQFRRIVVRTDLFKQYCCYISCILLQIRIRLLLNWVREGFLGSNWRKKTLNALSVSACSGNRWVEQILWTTSLRKSASTSVVNHVNELVQFQVALIAITTYIVNCLNSQVTTPCGHVFCRGCLDRVTDHSSKCPLCKNDLAYYVNQRSTPATHIFHQLIKEFLPDEYIGRQKQHEAEIAELARYEGRMIWLCERELSFGPFFHLMILACAFLSAPLT